MNLGKTHNNYEKLGKMYSILREEEEEKVEKILKKPPNGFCINFIKNVLEKFF